MKKILIAATAALCFASGSFAEETAGGTTAFDSAFGDISKPVIVAGSVGLGILGAVIANNRGSSTITTLVCGDGETLINGVCVSDEDPEPDPTCNGSDPLVDGICTGTSTTVTVTGTGTGTMTTTITVPVTFTYVPTV